MENCFGIYKKYWLKKYQRGTHQEATSLGGLPYPPGRAPRACGAPGRPPGPIFSYMNPFALEKKSIEDFRDEAPPSRGGTWAGELLLSGLVISSGILPSGRGKSKSSTSPTILSSCEDQSSSTSSPAPQIGTCGLLVVLITSCS